MRIQLKQNEIEEAIKGFLTRQGIATQGKAVVMDFTSGRKNNGLSVEVLIEDIVLPSMAEQYTDAPVPADSEEAYEATETQEAEEGVVQAVAPTVTAGSLFGN